MRWIVRLRLRALVVCALASLAGCGASSGRSPTQAAPHGSPEQDAAASTGKPAVRQVATGSTALAVMSPSAQPGRIAVPRPPSGKTAIAASPAIAQKCSYSALRALADERRVAPAERAAVDELLAQLRRTPSTASCASSQLTVLGRGTSSGTPDYVCLQAATLVMGLADLPGAPALRTAARRASTLIAVDERRGDGFCVSPTSHP